MPLGCQFGSNAPETAGGGASLRIRVPTFMNQDKGGPGPGGRDGLVQNGMDSMTIRAARGPALHIVYGRGMDEYGAETAVSPCVY